jgi:hypothetical protein
MKIGSTLILALFCSAIALASARAEDQQSQQVPMNAAICLLAIQSRRRQLSQLLPQPHFVDMSQYLSRSYVVAEIIQE